MVSQLEEGYIATGHYLCLYVHVYLLTSNLMDGPAIVPILNEL